MQPALKKSTQEKHKAILQKALELREQGLMWYKIAEKLDILPARLSQLRSAYGLTKLNDTCIDEGIDPNKVSNYWVKNQHISIHVKGGENVTYEDIRDELISEMRKHSPKYSKISRTRGKKQHLLVIDPADVHIGKLATLSGTGEEYNQDIAIKRLVEGVDGVLEKSGGFNIGKIMLVVGNDILHVDSPDGKTTKGTQMLPSMTWHEAFKLARRIYVDVIEHLMSIADVEVVFNPSNHDYTSGFMLVDALSCWFNTSKNVSFNDGIIYRKYSQYGNNLICTSHGDGAKEKDLPLLMASEAPKMWADTKHRYVYLHHIHHKKQINWQSGKDYHGVTVEYLRSPSSPDEWHYKNGYTQVPKAVEGFVHHKENGQVARLTNYF